MRRMPRQLPGQEHDRQIAAVPTVLVTASPPLPGLSWNARNRALALTAAYTGTGFGAKVNGMKVAASHVRAACGLMTPLVHEIGVQTVYQRNPRDRRAKLVAGAQDLCLQRCSVAPTSATLEVFHRVHLFAWWTSSSLLGQRLPQDGIAVRFQNVVDNVTIGY